MNLDPEQPEMQDFLHVAAADVLRRVVDRFGAAGIQVLPVKGVVSAYQLYAAPHERPISDIDVRVLPGQLRRARDVAHAQGWRELSFAPAYDNVVLEVSGLMVDIETQIGPPGLCSLRVADMLARSTLSERGHLVPDAYDHAVLLVVNAFKDKLVLAAPWSLEDLHRIVRQPTFSVSAFVSRVVEAETVVLTWFVADWLTRTRGDLDWETIRNRLAAQPPRPMYQRALSAAIARDPRSLAARLLARAGADDVRHVGPALAAAFRWRVRAALEGLGG